MAGEEPVVSGYSLEGSVEVPGHGHGQLATGAGGAGLEGKLLTGIPWVLVRGGREGKYVRPAARRKVAKRSTQAQETMEEQAGDWVARGRGRRPGGAVEARRVSQSPGK